MTVSKSLVLFGGQKVHRCTFWPPNKTSDLPYDTSLSISPESPAPITKCSPCRHGLIRGHPSKLLCQLLLTWVTAMITITDHRLVKKTSRVRVRVSVRVRVRIMELWNTVTDRWCWEYTHRSVIVIGPVGNLCFQFKRHTVFRCVTWPSRTLVFDRRTFPVLRSTCSWWVTTYVGKPSAVGQPTRPTQPLILSG